MAFSLGSKIQQKGQQFVSRALDRNLPGNDPVSKIGRNVLGASANRLLQAGLNIAGDNIPGFNNIVTATFRDNDTRVRLALSPGAGPMLYNDPQNQLLTPLIDTGGILFPYTPTISVSHTAQYAGSHPTHSNTVQHAYNASSVDSITIDSYFTANTADEARYVFAVLHFMRSAYKMFYGNDRLRGTPPPVLRLSGYGPFNYNSIPCVVQNFVEIMPADRDMIEVPLAAAPDAATKTMIPTFLPMTITLLPIYTKEQISRFNLDGFARGDLIGNPSRGGGFL